MGHVGFFKSQMFDVSIYCQAFAKTKGGSRMIIGIDWLSPISYCMMFVCVCRISEPSFTKGVSIDIQILSLKAAIHRAP